MLYEMTQKQFDKILKASQPIPMIAIHCGPIPSPQEVANRAWKALGEELGFDFKTVKPSSKGKMFFTATQRKRN